MKHYIDKQGVVLRFLAAIVVVMLTYNPTGYSYFHWAGNIFDDFSVLKLFAGIILLIGWSVFIRATLRSLGAFGLVLAIGFFSALIWLIVDVFSLSADSLTFVSWLVLVAISAILATGMSWSHIRRRMSGQSDVDDVGDD